MALLKRTIKPTILKIRRKLQEVRVTGTWEDQDGSGSPSFRTHHSHFSSILHNSPDTSTTATAVSSPPTLTELIHSLKAFMLGLAGIHPRPYLPTSPSFSTATVADVARFTFLDELAEEARPTARVVFEELADTRLDDVAFLDELASAASGISVLKSTSAFSVPSVYRSTLDELVSELEGEAFFENGKTTGRSGRGGRRSEGVTSGLKVLPILPFDSASQNGSDLSLVMSDEEYVTNGDDTDAAKLMTMMFQVERPPLFPHQPSSQIKR